MLNFRISMLLPSFLASILISFVLCANPGNVSAQAWMQLRLQPHFAQFRTEVHTNLMLNNVIDTDQILLVIDGLSPPNAKFNLIRHVMLGNRPRIVAECTASDDDLELLYDPDENTFNLTGEVGGISIDFFYDINDPTNSEFDCNADGSSSEGPANTEERGGRLIYRGADYDDEDSDSDDSDDAENK